MQTKTRSIPGFRLLAILAILGALLLGCASASGTGTQSANQPPAAPPPAVVVQPTAAAQSTQSTAPAVALKLLKVEPVSGPIGTQFTITGGGLPASKSVEFFWVTWDGGFETKVYPETVEFYQPKFAEKRVSMGRATTDAQGQVSLRYTAPEDYGDVHDIYIVADGQEIAKGGFNVLRSVSISPEQGPVGTPITVKVTGLGWRPLERAMALRYDNQYAGFVTAVTTRGTATAQIRAVGHNGVHTIELSGLGIHGAGYLNNQQSPYAHLFPQATGSYRLAFRVTPGTPIVSDAVVWPSSERVAMLNDGLVIPTTTGSRLAGVSASIEPSSSPILAKAALKARGLTPSSEVELFWVTARGNRVTPTGWNLAETSLLKTTTAGDGSLNANIQIPEDLGGWHMIKIVQGGKVATEVPYYVERSLVGVTPKRLKEGESFTIVIKGVGWTELDNGFGVTYDNAYMGYACGFNSNGDVTLNMVATGGPGFHLIDLYPMTYQGKGKNPWGHQMSHLTALQDHPGLSLGYRLPIFRLAIEIIE